VIFVSSFVSALLATHAAYPPDAAVLWGPLLTAIALAIAYYAGARHIMLNPIPVVP